MKIVSIVLSAVLLAGCNESTDTPSGTGNSSEPGTAPDPSTSDQERKISDLEGRISAQEEKVSDLEERISGLELLVRELRGALDRIREDLAENREGAKVGNGLAGGINIVFAQQNYTFTVAQVAKGISIDYKIMVPRDIEGVVPHSVGQVKQPDPSGLIPFEELTGNEQSYSIRDTGLGVGPGTEPVPIRKGTYPHSFKWDGKNWSGPSDYGHPKGPSFPPGSYTLSVRCSGNRTVNGEKKNFLVEKEVRVILLP